MNIISKSVTEQNARPHKYLFGEFTLDLDRGALLKNNAEVHLRPKCFDVLCYLVAHHGVLLGKDKILGAVWPGVVVTDDSLTQCVIDVRKALGDENREIVHTVPRRGYLFDLPVTVSGEDKTVATATRARPRNFPRWTLTTAIALTLLALASWIFDSRDAGVALPRGRAVPMSPTSIAVLPFVDMSPQGDQGYFAEGLSEEVLNLLAQTAELTVIARTSSFSFRGENPDIRTIARKLNVAKVLEGSVRKDGDRVRVTAQLVDTSNSAHLWSQTYDRTLDNVFSVQSDIAGAVAKVLKVKLLGNTYAPGTEAHAAFMRGRYLVARRTEASVKQAVREFEKAVMLAPDYAIAHAELSLANRRLSFSGKMSREEAVSLARPPAERAMTLDPNLAQAHAAIGYVVVTPQTIDTAISHFRRATELNPNYSDAFTWLGYFLHHQGQYGEAFLNYEKALRTDPLSLTANANYAVTLVYRNRLAEAAEQLETLAAIARDYHAASGISGELQSLGGQWAKALLEDLRSLRYDPSPYTSERLAAIGLEKESLALGPADDPTGWNFLRSRFENIATAEARLAAQPGRQLVLGDLGLALATAGESERAGDLLEEQWQLCGKMVTESKCTADFAMALMWIRRGLGDEEGAIRLREAMRDNVRRYREAGITRGSLFWNPAYEEGLVSFLDGDREEGLAAIARGAEDGYFIRPDAAFLQVLYDASGFAPILAAQRARQARERDKFLAVVCRDNPYQDVWQPLPQTCAQSGL